MRRFLASGWFPLLMCLVLAGVTVAAFTLLHPTGEDVSNSDIVNAFRIAGWVAGPVVGLLSLVLIGTLNLLRRIVRLRKTPILHPVVVLLGILPWFVFSWALLDEPRFTGFAIAAMEFVARPMLWGSLVTVLLTIVLSLPLIFSKKK